MGEATLLQKGPSPHKAFPTKPLPHKASPTKPPPTKRVNRAWLWPDTLLQIFDFSGAEGGGDDDGEIFFFH